MYYSPSRSNQYDRTQQYSPDRYQDSLQNSNGYGRNYHQGMSSSTYQDRQNISPYRQNDQLQSSGRYGGDYSRPQYLQPRTHQPRDENDEIVTSAFKLIAEGETTIEYKRQDLAIEADFEPNKAFNHLDRGAKGYLEPNDLCAFALIKYAEACQVIKEFDGTLDNRLNFEEFCQMTLPAANSNLRQLSVDRLSNQYYKPNEPLSSRVIEALKVLIKSELNMHQRLNKIREKLMHKRDAKIPDLFKKASDYRETISMAQMVAYLEAGRFYPRGEHIEAILRRCDHDATRNISLNEFYETLSKYYTPEEEAAAKAIQKNCKAHLKSKVKERNDAATKIQKKYKQKSKEQNQVQQDKPFNNSANRSLQAKVQKAPSKTINIDQQRQDQEKLRQEERARQAEQEHLTKQVEHLIFVRLVKLMMQQDRVLESARETLACHVNFSMQDAFEQFDQENKGYINSQDIKDVFAGYKINIQNIHRLVKYLDINKNGQITYQEFAKFLTLKSRVQQREQRSFEDQRFWQSLSQHQKTIQQQSWFESMADIFNTFVENEIEYHERKTELGLKAERLFEELDEYQMGYITGFSLRRWLLVQCSFNIPEQDVRILQDRLDRNSDYMITKQEFLANVAPDGELDEDDEFEREYENTEDANIDKYVPKVDHVKINSQQKQNQPVAINKNQTPEKIVAQQNNGSNNKKQTTSGVEKTTQPPKIQQDIGNATMPRNQNGYEKQVTVQAQNQSDKGKQMTNSFQNQKPRNQMR